VVVMTTASRQIVAAFGHGPASPKGPSRPSGVERSDRRISREEMMMAQISDGDVYRSLDLGMVLDFQSVD
jgi:hypothetical protein